MTEREKMLAGLPYDCGDRELMEQWYLAKRLTQEYNRLDAEDLRGRADILRRLLGGAESEPWITPPFFVDYGCNIFLGRNCEINMNCTFLDTNRITVGDNALIAPNVQIYTAYHPASPAQRFGEPREDGSFAFCKTLTAPVTIGKNVWIGGGTVILPGVSIGDDTVIGAGSVVTKDIPAGKIAFGNPCRVYRDNI